MPNGALVPGAAEQLDFTSPDAVPLALTVIEKSQSVTALTSIY